LFYSNTKTPTFSPLHRCADKKYPEDLPSISIVLIYLDEALSIIKRAIRSLIDKTPARLMKEIILVNDHSSNGTSTCHIMPSKGGIKILKLQILASEYFY